MNQPYKIYNKCYQNDPDEGICFHYIQWNTVYDNPIIGYCIHKGDVVKKATKKEIEELMPKDGICGNPWNVIQDELAQTIRNEKPEIQQQPMANINQNVVRMYMVNQVEILNTLRGKIFADVYGVYTRKSESLEVVKIYYSRSEEDDGNTRDFANSDNILLGMWNTGFPTDMVIVMNGSLKNYYIQRIETSWLFGKTYKYMVCESN